jgi:hypothetical protein
VKLPRAALALLAGALYSLPSLAVTIYSDLSNAAYYNVSDPQFNGIGRLFVNGGGICTAFAISSNQVLTAAHCLPGGNPGLAGSVLDGVQFSLFSQAIYAPTSVFINPNWNYTAFEDGHDIAVLYFENGLPNVNNYPIYSYAPGEDEYGDTFELFGFGQCGTPQTGAAPCSTPGLHRGANRYDNIYSNGNILEFGFDRYTTDTVTVGPAECRINDALCYVTEIETLSKEFVSEIGTRQGFLAPGDSGGPSLIFADGRYWSVGLHSYISCISLGTRCDMPPDFDNSLGPNSTWGEIAGDTRLGSFTDFVEASVPEPSTFLLSGAALLLLFRRTRMLHSSESSARSTSDGESSQAHLETQSSTRP